uniref:Uncharacterized protein n=1 Tax=Strombidium rassoulzadegani TaxID=1082188 RepID=A0A7S3CR63_9SPIT|mmetsp:Transcript_19184/g.32681  ORF Transcript_19184/g.32681 Transcript_19184/m.32681 type:complete len:159 (+) Transcript_19184:181-657(+)
MMDAFLTKRQQFLHEEYWNSHMKEEILKSDSDFKDSANDIYFEEKDKFWVPVRKYNEEEETHVGTGEILCSIQILTKRDAEKFPQGEGRAEPNSDPFLPEPEGRIKLSINPFDMLRQIIPAAMWRKIFLSICCGLCIFLCVMMAPMIFSNLVSKILFG